MREETPYTLTVWQSQTKYLCLKSKGKKLVSEDQIMVAFGACPLSEKGK